MADKDTLVADIERLKGELAPVFERDQARITGEDRPFDAQGWALGKPDSHKYPTGAAFWPIGNNPTLINSFRQMTVRDLTEAGIGGAFFFALGYSSAGRLGVRSPLTLGVWTAVPAVLVALLAGLQRGTHRYTGLISNGNPPIYAGYKEDNTPYFVKHEVSDRRYDVPKGTAATRMS